MRGLGITLSVVWRLQLRLPRGLPSPHNCLRFGLVSAQASLAAEPGSHGVAAVSKRFPQKNALPAAQ